MTALAAVEVVDAGTRELLADYGEFVDGLDIGPSPRWARLRAARLFVSQHPDLATWMTLPSSTRLRDLHRGGYDSLKWPRLGPL
jgi:hypothetical protein